MDRRVRKIRNEATTNSTDLQFATDWWSPHFIATRGSFEAAVREQTSAL